jgi:hypothetical protein
MKAVTKGWRELQPGMIVPPEWDDYTQAERRAWWAFYIDTPRKGKARDLELIKGATND